MQDKVNIQLNAGTNIGNNNKRNLVGTPVRLRTSEKRFYSGKLDSALKAILKYIPVIIQVQAILVLGFISVLAQAVTVTPRRECIFIRLRLPETVGEF